jgi:hypothetical protein
LALPLLYWMLECPRCGTRRVVRDQNVHYSYDPKSDTRRKPGVSFVPDSGALPSVGIGYGDVPGPPIEERYSCSKKCSGSLRVVGSIFRPQDREMRLRTGPREPIKIIKMDQQQIDEWLRLIRAAGFEC